MTTPASIAFRREAGRTLVVIRVFEWCENNLDYTEPRRVKRVQLEHDLGIDRADTRPCLNWLVDRGYLIEHERDERGVRRFTLAWSLNPERRRA